MVVESAERLAPGVWVTSFSKVYWLGGVTCSGKTSAARCLADRFSLRLYSTDDSFNRHLQEIDREKHPTL